MIDREIYFFCSNDRITLSVAKELYIVNVIFDPIEDPHFREDDTHGKKFMVMMLETTDVIYCAGAVAYLPVIVAPVEDLSTDLLTPSAVTKDFSVKISCVDWPRGNKDVKVIVAIAPVPFLADAVGGRPRA